MIQYDNTERKIDRLRTLNATGVGAKKKGRQKKVKLEHKVRRINLNQIHLDFDGEMDNVTEWGNRSEHWEYGHNQSFPSEDQGHTLVRNKEKWADLRRPKPPERKNKNLQDGFFCDLPSE